MNYKLLVLLLGVVFVSTSSSESQYLFPPENYKHGQKLAKVCEEGRKTYGANEFVENGKVCRWTMVPYWPEKKA